MQNFDWFAYAEQTTERFIERFADLDPGKHPGKVSEITEARRLRLLRDGFKLYNDVVDKMLAQAERAERRYSAFAKTAGDASGLLADFRRVTNRSEE